MFGGAQLTDWVLLTRLHAEYGFECAMFTPYKRKHTHTEEGVMLTTYRDVDELKGLIRTAKPDVVLASSDAISDGLQIAAYFDIPSLVYLHSFEFYSPRTAEKRLWQLDLSRNYPSQAERDYMQSAADLHMVNSRFMQTLFANKFGLRTRVLYPEFERDGLHAPDKAEYITGVCGMPYKGAGIFLALAEAFPEETFLLVGDVHPDYLALFQRRGNIILRGRDKPNHILRESKIVLVPSQWQEPFGRIAVEALGAGIPTLVSYTGGLREIVGDAPFGVRRFRAADAWRAKLKALLASSELRAAYSAEGRKRGAKFLRGESTRQLARWVTEVARRRTPHYDAAPMVALRGAQGAKTAFSMVNRAWYEVLAHESRIQIQAVERGDAAEVQLPDVVIDSDFAQNFSELTPPRCGKWVVVRTWDFGPFPEKWVKKINRECDQLWVHSDWIRRQAIAGGVEARRVRVVPLGIDPRVFRPEGKVYPLPTKKRFKFLFVGAAVLRKGIDILLEAYGAAFTRDDDVCLVIKAHGVDVFYKGISYRDEIEKWQSKPDAPEIIYLNRYLTAQEMGAVYRACDVSVFPYRAEGFGMPILEAMASGTPPIVPKFGTCLDFCNASSAFLIPVRRIKIPVQGEFAINTLGFTEELKEVDFAQVRVATLSEFLVRAYRLSRERLEKKAGAGVKRAHAHFTWEDSAEEVLREIALLENKKTPHRLQSARQTAEEHQRKLETAEKLYRAYFYGKG